LLCFPHTSFQTTPKPFHTGRDCNVATVHFAWRQGCGNLEPRGTLHKKGRYVELSCYFGLFVEFDCLLNRLFRTTITVAIKSTNKNEVLRRLVPRSPAPSSKPSQWPNAFQLTAFHRRKPHRNLQWHQRRRKRYAPLPWPCVKHRSTNLVNSFKPIEFATNLALPTEVSTRPTISLDSRVEGKYMVVFTDLSISGVRYNGTSLPLAQGLQACRTTRLHWLQTGLTQAENGIFVVEDGTPAVAPYGESRSLS
jgi:hypothetical protein